jgi:alpha-tubulin suppressor-like RCC1 family protein
VKGTLYTWGSQYLLASSLNRSPYYPGTTSLNGKNVTMVSGYTAIDSDNNMYLWGPTYVNYTPYPLKMNVGSVSKLSSASQISIVLSGDTRLYVIGDSGIYLGNGKCLNLRNKLSEQIGFEQNITNMSAGESLCLVVGNNGTIYYSGEIRVPDTLMQAKIEVTRANFTLFLEKNVTAYPGTCVLGRDKIPYNVMTGLVESGNNIQRWFFDPQKRVDPIQGLTNIYKITSSSSHILISRGLYIPNRLLGLHNNGSVFSWQAGFYDSPATRLTALENLPNRIIDIALGQGLGIWTLDNDGDIYMFDDNMVPQLISTSALAPGVKFTAIELGQSHALALASDGTVYSYGSGIKGQLGAGPTILSRSVLQPVYSEGVLGNKTISKIFAGTNDSFALDNNGVVYIWGEMYGDQYERHFYPITEDLDGLLRGVRIISISTTAQANVVPLALADDGGVYILNLKMLIFTPPAGMNIVGVSRGIGSSFFGHCREGYTGKECSTWSCFNKFFNSTDVCMKHGACVAPDICACESSYSGNNCEQYSCFGIQSDSPNVCTGNGVCADVDTCVCKDSYFGRMCKSYYCYDTLYNASTVCSSHGWCASPDNCTCDSGYYRDQCNMYNCNRLPKTDPNSCGGTGIGECTAPNTCSCRQGFSGQKCEIFTCFDILNTNTSYVCSGNGTCKTENKCICKDPRYIGLQCESWTCFGVPRSVCNELDIGCTNHGRCIGPDICTCGSGYYGVRCDVWDCYGKAVTSDSVCNGHGECIMPNICKCNATHHGHECEIPLCYGIEASSLQVCSHHGKCTAYDSCICDPGYSGPTCNQCTGPQCQQDQTDLGYILGGTLGGLLALVVIISIPLFLGFVYYYRQIRKRRLETAKMELIMREKLLSSDSIELGGYERSSQEWLIDREDLELKERLSEGSFGVVFK